MQLLVGIVVPHLAVLVTLVVCAWVNEMSRETLKEYDELWAMFLRVYLSGVCVYMMLVILLDLWIILKDVVANLRVPNL